MWIEKILTCANYSFTTPRHSGQLLGLAAQMLSHPCDWAGSRGQMGKSEGMKRGFGRRFLPYDKIHTDRELFGQPGGFRCFPSGAFGLELTSRLGGLGRPDPRAIVCEGVRT